MDIVDNVASTGLVGGFPDIGGALSQGPGWPAGAFGGNVLAADTAFTATCASRFLFGAPNLGHGASIAAVAQLGCSRSG